MPKLELCVKPVPELLGKIVSEPTHSVTGTDAAIQARLKALVEERGGNRAFADFAGIPLSSLNNYLSGTAMKLPVLIKIADAAGISIDQLIGRDQTSRDVTSGIMDGFVPIPHLSIRASAGPGLAAISQDLDGSHQVAFRETWLRSLGVTPANAEFLTAEGDSMFPTIQNGDLMLIDRGYGEVVNGRIYVLVVNGLVVVKRVSLLAFGGLMLISDNDRYPAETVSRDEVDALSFQGRVAWYGRSV